VLRVTSLVILALGVAAPVAHADVFLDVPVRFLGGPIAPAVPVAASPAAVEAPDGEPISIAAEPPAGTPLVGYPCESPDPVECMRWSTTTVDFTPPEGDVTSDDPPLPASGPAATPPTPPTPDEVARAAGGLLSPAPEAWLPWQRPVLRWTPSDAATHYNVQVFRGSRLVMSAWSRSARLRVPAGVLKQGRTYVWVVWAGRGTPAMPSYDPAPVGRAAFEVTLRPRHVFRANAARPGTVVAEVRPHIPMARLRFTNVFSRPALRPVPRVVTLSAKGRVLLPVNPRVAERLQVALTDRGPAPPLGLRAP